MYHHIIYIQNMSRSIAKNPGRITSSVARKPLRHPQLVIVKLWQLRDSLSFKFGLR